MQTCVLASGLQLQFSRHTYCRDQAQSTLGEVCQVFHTRPVSTVRVACLYTIWSMHYSLLVLSDSNIAAALS